MVAVRPWPNTAKETRDQAAEEAATAIRALRPMVYGESLAEREVLRRQAIALVSLQQIARLLESMGAPTSPLLEVPRCRN